MTIAINRLPLRPWRREDLAPFASLNADSRVMEHYPTTFDRAESDAIACALERPPRRAGLRASGFGLWAVEAAGVADFVGYVGLSEPAFEAHFTPCVEVGRRLAFEHWGRGYATETANAVLAHAFGPLGLQQVVSFTTPGNGRSRRVMERLGMRRLAADDFAHPTLPEGDRLRLHVL